MPAAIEVRNISKKYRLGVFGYGSLMNDMSTFWAKFRGKPDPNAEIGHEFDYRTKGEFWALKDLNFDVNEGELIGIIGRNGAGKSTLLKILSRITEPTSGHIKYTGRIASMLEVGTGFHPELTGRENVFLNGAILGMNRQEISSKFDQIVDFSGVEQFIDTPVKRYSSGMYVRLAFAVAAHLEPDILLIDEVLAVGDANFQAKCIGKMGEVSREGRTVLFVSHNMAIISRLCSKAMLLGGGEIQAFGDTRKTIETYRESGKTSEDGQSLTYRNHEKSTGILEAEIHCSEAGGVHRCLEPFELNFLIRLGDDIGSGSFSFQIVDDNQDAIVHRFIYDTTNTWSDKGTYRIQCSFPKSRLYMGDYFLRIYLADRSNNIRLDTVDCCRFSVVMDGIERIGVWGKDDCKYVEDAIWHINKEEG